MTDDFKQYIKTHIEKMGDAHIMECLRYAKADKVTSSTDPKVIYAFEKLWAEAEKRKLV